MKMRELTLTCGLLLLLPTAAWSAHTRTWHIHANTTTTEEQVGAWHTDGTSRLQTDDDDDGDADRKCCLTIAKGATDAGWTYTGGDSTPDVMDSDAEISLVAGKMTKNSAALTSEYTGTPGLQTGSVLMMFGDPDCSTLVHEVGHIAGCSHVSVDKRFMTPSNDPSLASGVSGRAYVSEDEKTSYEALN